MSRNAKVLLILSLICFVAGGAINLGLVSAHGVASLYTILPLGAVFFGLFLIVQVMHKAGDIRADDQHSNRPSGGGEEGNAHPGE
jgi:hypothetical protein